MDEQQAIFENAGQAVHVAFLVMAQEATQDAPLRKALIRAMESVQLEAGQQHWLDQLRGAQSGGSVNFDGLSPGDIRAQCALITQAVTTNLPAVERWVLQAKYGQTDFEDVIDHDATVAGMAPALEQAQASVSTARATQALANAEMVAAVEVYRRSTVALRGHAISLAAHDAVCARYDSAREALIAANDGLIAAEAAMQAVQIVSNQARACRLADNGPRPGDPRSSLPSGMPGASRRRFAFSVERIDAIKGLSDWFAPMFPRLKPLALDCMLGRMFANHKKLDISARDIAARFGGSYSTYLRASWKMKNHLRILEEQAIERLTPVFIAHGVVTC